MPSSPTPRSITLLQCAMSVGTTVIGVGVLAFPRITVEYAKTGAPMVTMAGVMLIILCGIALTYVISRFPNKDLFECADALFGKWFGAFFTVAITAYFLVLAALAAREFGEVVVTSVLQRTPLEVTILIMLVLAAIAARNNVTVVTRTLTFYMPLVYFPAIVIVLLTLKSAHFVNVLPAFQFFSDASVRKLVEPMLIVASLFQNYMVVGLFVPHMYRPKEAWKSVLIGVGAAGIIYVIVIYSTLAVFGFDEIKNLLWPTLELAKTAALPLLFLERMDPIFIAVWVTAVFSAIFASYYVAVKGLKHMFRFQNHRVFTLILLPVIYLLAMQSPNIVVLYKVVKIVGMSGLVLTAGGPLTMYMLYFVRNTKRSKKGERKAA